MTVKQLKEELSKYDDSRRVLIWIDADGVQILKEVRSVDGDGAAVTIQD